MRGIAQLSRHLNPTPLQTTYCLISAGLLSLYWCRNQLLYYIATNSHVPSSELHDSFTAAFNQATSNDIASYLSLGLFWALVGLVTVALLYESANVIIEARNDFVIATTYTDTISFERSLLKNLATKAMLVAGFLLFALFSWKLFGTWHDLIAQPAPVLFRSGSILKEAIGFVGLTVNIYLGWMWSLYLVPRFFR